VEDLQPSDVIVRLICLLQLLKASSLLLGVMYLVYYLLQRTVYNLLASLEEMHNCRKHLLCPKQTLKIKTSLQIILFLFRVSQRMLVLISNDKKRSMKTSENRYVGFNEEVERIVSAYQTPFVRSKEEAWSVLRGKITTKKQKTRVIPFESLKKWAIAASWLLLLSAGIVTYSYRNQTITVADGNKLIHALPDGSKVHINAGSEIVYSRYFYGFKRSITLQGEAYFEVVKGNTFEVLTQFSRTTVLGTKFNVYARGNSHLVVCESGKVRVESLNAGGQVFLIAGEKVVIGSSNKALIKEIARPAKDLAWMRGEFYFENKKLAEVFSELQRQFNIKFEFERFENRYYSGFFDTRDLKTALDLVCVPMGLNYKIFDGRVYITSSNY